MQNHLTRPPFERRTSPRGRPDGRGIGNGVEESPDSRKQRCRVTPGRGNPTDSATEIRPPSHRSGNRNHGAVRVKRWGKSPPRRWQQGWHGKPHREQCQIGTARRKTGLLLPQQVRVGSLSLAGNRRARGMVIEPGLAPGNRIRLTGLPRIFFSIHLLCTEPVWARMSSDPRACATAAPPTGAKRHATTCRGRRVARSS